MAPLEWYYAKGNKQHGPATAAELKQLAAAGQLKPDDLVWCEKLDDWTPARKVGGLFDGEGGAAVQKPVDPPGPAAPPKVAPSAGASPAFAKSEAAFERSRQRPVRHLFDVLLELARPQFTMQFIELTSRIFTWGGHYGLYFAMLLLLLFRLLLGVKLNEVNTILMGTAQVVFLVVLQYTALRYFGAMDRLNRSTPARMCSAAFLDCYALLNVVGGLVVLLGLTVLAVQTGLYWLVLPAIGAFILCQYVAVLALNPEALNLTIASEATAGEEALGVLSFLVKLGMRLVPVAFGVGVIGGTMMLLYAAVLLFAPPEGLDEIAEFVGVERMEEAMGPGGRPVSGDEGAGSSEGGPTGEEILAMLPARVTAATASTILIVSAALPFLAYLGFLFSYLSIDVLRAILAMPGKLEEK